MAIAHEKKRNTKNLICNFRAPNLEFYGIWQEFKQWCKDNGLDVCRVTLSNIASFMKAVESIPDPEQMITAKGQVNIIQQQNTFVYPVGKPRREPIRLNCSKPEFSGTISRAAFEAYVMEKARDLKRSFCFRDFAELNHNSFRKIILRLKKKGKIIPLPLRTNPRFYILAERLPDYPTASKNTRVKQLFTQEGGDSG